MNIADMSINTDHAESALIRLEEWITHDEYWLKKCTKVNSFNSKEARRSICTQFVIDEIYVIKGIDTT